MTNRIPTPPKARTVIVGVDTHTHVHVAVAIDSWGIRLGDHAFVADSGGYEALVTWAETHGRIEAFGIEGTGSYGAGLARAVHRAGHHVVEVNRGDRRTRRAAGKSDTIDAEVAARSLLAGQSTAIPKTADGAVEMIRQLKITRDTAMKARTTAMNTLKQIIVQAPPVLREALHDLTDHGLLTRCAGLRPGPIDTPIASAKHTLRSLARRWMALAEEIALHDQHLARLTTATSPTLCEGFGVGAHTAAELLIIFGDNPDRIRSEAAFATLCGACPIPASSGMTTGRHRLNRGGHRHANAALYRAVIVRMQFHQPTRDYVARRIAAGRTKRDIIRCLRRFLAREIYQRVMTDFRAPVRPHIGAVAAMLAQLEGVAVRGGPVPAAAITSPPRRSSLPTWHRNSSAPRPMHASRGSGMGRQEQPERICSLAIRTRQRGSRSSCGGRPTRHASALGQRQRRLPATTPRFRGSRHLSYSDRCRHAARSIDLNADFFLALADLYCSGWHVKTSIWSGREAYERFYAGVVADLGLTTETDANDTVAESELATC